MFYLQDELTQKQDFTLSATAFSPTFDLPSSAKEQLSDGQRHFFGVSLVVMVVGLLLGIHPLTYLLALIALITAGYLSLVVFNLFLIISGFAQDALLDVTDEVKRLDWSSLPTYTILVPLYRESRVINQLIRNLAELDYPTDKLRVILLLESDDAETAKAINPRRLPSHFQVIRVPVSEPRTKPKALNYGLQFVRSEFCVVYDAEDRPECDQLLKAVTAFRRLPRHVVCLQAMLAYHNPRQNLLTRFFAAEYTSWFTLYIPGLARNNLLFLLGGTSNHFRTAALHKIGAWDPYNVTEDADLGIRLARAGYSIKALKSITWEEANSRSSSWINQRSRWIKGYMQTYLAHMRDPLLLLQELGLKRFVAFQLMVGIAPFTNMVNPIFWGLTVLYFLTHWAFIETLYPGMMLYLSMVSLLVGNFVAIFISLSGAILQQEYGSVKWMLFTPVYWAMMSAAAWKAFYQLIVKPSYWEKTQHGLVKQPVTLLDSAPSSSVWQGLDNRTSGNGQHVRARARFDERRQHQAVPAYYLEVNTPQAVRRVPLTDRRLLIGRNANRCDLHIRDRQVSRVHLFVKRDASAGVVIADLKTTNGTRIAGRRLKPGIPTRWKPDEPVSIGETQVMLRYGQIPNGEHMLNEETSEDVWLAYAS